MDRHLIGDRRLAAASLGIVLTAAWPTAHAAAQTVKFDVNPGLWEMTSTMTASGAEAMMEEQLAQVPPDKRPQMEAMMKSIMAGMAKPRKVQECITPERIRDGFKLPERNRSSCTRTVATNTASELRMHEECTGPNPRSGDYRFETSDPTMMHGAVDMTMTHGAHTMTSKVEIAGRWLAADCGDVQPGHPKME